MKNFNLSLSVLLILAFILFTIIGTLSHESGHYIMLKLSGRDAVISYKSTHPILENEELLSGKEYCLMLLGGPLQTMLTGTFGFILLLINYKSIKETDKLSVKHWLFIFITFFWARQIAILCRLAGGFIFDGKFSHSGDEANLDKYFNFPFLSLNIITAILAIIILSIVVFKIIPAGQRKTFIISGIIGGLAGVVLWMFILGPILLP